jgi:hypothetical protein
VSEEPAEPDGPLLAAHRSNHCNFGTLTFVILAVFYG